MTARKLRVAITHGDTNGIGYELIFKTFAQPEMLELCTPIVYGSPKVAAYHRNALEIPAVFSIVQKVEDIHEGKLNLITTFEDDVKIELGKCTPEGTEAAKKAIDAAVKDFQEGLVDILVMAPAQQIDGQTQADYLAAQLGTHMASIPVLIGNQMCVGFATWQKTLDEVTPLITPETLEEKLMLLQQTLKRDLRISKPRIAVLSLNPYGSQSRTDEEIVAPTVQQLRDKGAYVFGPFTAEELLYGKGYQAFDGVLALYDEQGLLVFHAINSQEGVLLQTGIAATVTSTHHINIYMRAGKGEADEQTFRTAIYTALDVHQNRLNYDEPLKDPLPKLYHERRDESEKVRFNIPKKKTEEQTAAESTDTQEKQ